MKTVFVTDLCGCMAFSAFNTQQTIQCGCTESVFILSQLLKKFVFLCVHFCSLRCLCLPCLLLLLHIWLFLSSSPLFCCFGFFFVYSLGHIRFCFFYFCSRFHFVFLLFFIWFYCASLIFVVCFIRVVLRAAFCLWQTMTLRYTEICRMNENETEWKAGERATICIETAAGKLCRAMHTKARSQL